MREFMKLCHPSVYARSAALALPLAILSAFPVAGQYILEGKVIDSRSEVPVPEAVVQILGENRSPRGSVVTNREGSFSLQVTDEADLVLRVQALGYAVLEVPPPEAGGRILVPVLVRLGVDAVPVNPLVVTAEAVVTRSVFQRRMQMGLENGRGVFLARADLEEAGAGARMSTILRRIPGLVMAQTLDGETVLGVPVREGSRHTYPSHRFDPSACRPRLLVNGAEVSQHRPIDELVSPEQLEGVEVYRDGAETPSELGGFQSCGAVVFWTREAQVQDGPFSFWRNVAGGVLAAGLAALWFF